MGVLRKARQAVGRWIAGKSRPVSAPLDWMRVATAAYDGVQTNDSNANYWSAADYLSADDANSPEVRRTARSRARYEMESDPSAYGMVATIANDLIGTEIRLQILDVDSDDAKFVEREFTDWMYAVELAEKLRTARIAKAVDGEAVVLLTQNPHIGTPVTLDFHPVACDRLSDPRHPVTYEPNNIDGVILDEFGNRVEYCILHEYPHALVRRGTGMEFTVYPAERVLHWYRAVRPEQHRGVSELLPALPLFGLRHQYLIAVVDAAINAAQQSLIYKTNNSAEIEADDAVATRSPWEFYRNQATVLPYAYDVMQLRAEQPTGTFEAFDDHLLREIARCLLLPRNAATGDSSKYNYASGRLDKQTYWRAINVDRVELQRKVLDRVLHRWLSEAVLIEDYLPETFRAYDYTLRHKWFFDGPLHVDPVKEAQAKQILLDAGLLTHAEACAERGMHWRDEFDQLAEERRYAAGLGLSFDWVTTATERPAVDGEEPETVIERAKRPNQTKQDIEVSPDMTLNGAQIASAAQIVEQVASGVIGRDTGLGMLEVLLNLTREQALRVLGSAGQGVPRTQSTPEPAA